MEMRAEHVAGLIIAGACLLISAWLFSHAMHGLSYAVAGVIGVFVTLMGLTALRIVTGDLRRGQ